MHSVSSGYSRIIAGEHRFDTRVTIAGSQYADDQLISVATRAHTFGSDELQLGRADSREIEISLFGSSASIPRNAEMVVETRPVSYDGSSAGEWVRKGIFYIDTRSKDHQQIDGDEVISIVGMDAMMRGERYFENLSDGWPEENKPDYEVVQMCADILGVSVDSRTWNIIYSKPGIWRIPLPAQYTVRETLANIAGLYGGSFIINDYGYLQLICLWNRPTTVSIGKNAQGLTIVPPHESCIGVRMILEKNGYATTDDDEDVEYYLGGSEYGNGYVFEIPSPWATQAQADWLYSKLAGYVYGPYSASVGELDPAVEIGDYVTVSNPDGNGVTGGMYTQEITFGPYLTCDFGAPGEEEIDHEYSFESSKDRQYTRRLYNAEATLSIHETEIAARVKKVDGNTEESFGWSLQSDHWEVFSGEGSSRQTVLYVDKNGLQVYGGGTFTGALESGEIYIPSRDNYNFKVDSGGNMEAKSAEVTGIIRASSFQTSEGSIVATLDDLNSIRQLSGGSYGGTGMLAALNAGSKFGKSTINQTGDYPEYFTCGTLIAQSGILARGNISTTGSVSAYHYYITGSDTHGDNSIDLATHSHSIRFDEDGDRIKLTINGPTGINPSSASFRIAATQTYRDMVAALTVTSIGISSSYNYSTHKYSISATAYNQAGSALLTRGTTTDTTAYDDGYSDGYSSGYNSGESDGYNSGYEAGHSDGYWEGYYDGLDEGQNNAYVWLDIDADYNWDGELYRYSVYAYCSSGDYDHDYIYV